MRHSLLVRWLALTLTIALGSIIATAALATYGTTEQLKQQNPDASSLVETDNAILQELNRYAISHQSWDGVHRTVRELADRFGRRIALRTPDGTVLADSAGVQLPSNAAATIDAAGKAADQTVDGSVGVTVSGALRDTASGDPSSVGELEPLVAAPASDAVRSGSAVSSVWTEETIEQTELCVQGNDDLVHGLLLFTADAPVAVRSVASAEPAPKQQDSSDLKATPQPTRTVPPKDAAGETKRNDAPAAEIELLDLRGDPCLPAELEASTARTKKIDERQNARLRRCLDRADIEYARNTQRLGAAAVELTEPIDNADEKQLRGCAREATQQALQGFVAPPALLYLGTSDRFDAFSAQGFWRTATMAFAVLVAAALVTVFAGRRMVRPIQALTGAAQRVAAGDHDARVPESGNDEVARMGVAFNRMAESVQAGERQRKAMVSDVAHELRNPLANVRGYLEAVQDGVVELDAELVSSLQEEARLLDRLVDDLQDLALADAGELRLHPQHCELSELVELAEQVATVHQAQADDAGVSLLVREAASEETAPSERTGPSDETAEATVLVDPARMRQAIGNLVSNALAYTSDGGQVLIEVRGRSLAVADTGAGIAAEHLPHLFDRFYRADSSRNRRTGGSGLGLAITKHLVQAHGGTIDVTSTVGEGTTFTIDLPPAALD